MFLTTNYSGYNRHGEQVAAGRFLILMEPKWESVKYPHNERLCRVCRQPRETHQTAIPYVPACPEHGIVARLKARKNDTEAELDALCNAGERFVTGCPACEASKIYSSHCFSFTPNSIKYPMRAIVCYTRFCQCGQFMMGTTRIAGEKLVLSGSYGGDGLPMSVSDTVYVRGIDVPMELVAAWNTGGGWNGAGSEAAAMREWALKTFSRK